MSAEARFVTTPIVAPIGQMALMPDGISDMLNWVRDRAPACVPEERPGYDELGSLFPHDLSDGNGRHLSHNEMLIELAGRKCLAAGSLVLTSRGPIPIEDVRIGDQVIVGGSTHRVDSVDNNGTRQVVRVVTKAGYSVSCTEDHRILTKSADGAETWVEAGELAPGDILVLNSGVWSDPEPSATVRDAGYCCGLFLGDGTFAGSGFEYANIRLFDEKKQLASIVQDVTGALPRPQRGGQCLSFNSREWAQAMLAYGIKHGFRGITTDVERSSQSFQIGVLSGLFDTDGSLEIVMADGTAKTRRWLLSSNDLDSLHAAQRMLLNLGIRSRIKRDKKKGYTATSKLVDQPFVASRDSYKLTISGASFRTFFEVVGTRRKERALLAQAAIDAAVKWSEREYAIVERVESAGAAEVFDLGVRDVHRFSANGIIVHNCYNSFGLKAGRKSNADYISHTQQGDVPHASILYHAKMSFFIAGVSRRVSHELIRNYVGADRTEEGAPSQESTRYVENAGFYIIPPRYLLPGHEQARAQFEQQCHQNFHNYRSIISGQIQNYTQQNGKRPTGIDYKRILEAGSGTLIHSVETSFIWTTNPGALAKLFRERDNEAADLEFQRFARQWKRVCMKFWPNAFPQPWMREGL